MALTEKRQQELIRLVGEGSGDPELDDKHALDEQEKRRLQDLNRERADFLRTCTSAEELDFFAAHWARDGREKPIHALVDNPHTDAGTLLRVYWYSDPECFYSEYGSVADADDATERDIMTTLERIERRITGSEYKTASVRFDPAGHVTMADRRSQFARPIPEVMYRPITG
jgi:hypothetical protein